MEVGELLPRLSTLAVRCASGGLFLLPFSGGYPRLMLSVTLPSDARTFLTVLPFGLILRSRPAWLPVYYTIFPAKSQGEPLFFDSVRRCGRELFGLATPGLTVATARSFSRSLQHAPVSHD